MPEAEYLSPKEAAVVAGVSVQTIHRRIKDGTLPARKFGQLWRIRRADLDRLLSPVPPPRPPQRRRPTSGKG